MQLSLIAAVADNSVIGRGNDIPWRLPEDWRRFKATTMGHHLLMGRHTWESIGRPLPGRTMVVISRDPGLEVPQSVMTADSLEAAVELARGAGDSEAFVAGGAEIYRQCLDRVDRMYLTRVHAKPDGDTLFPDWDPSSWSIVESEFRAADERHPYACTFQVLERTRR